MMKMTIKAHFITIFYLIRSYWVIFTAPLVRIGVQYVIYKDAQLFLPIEAVILLLAVFIAIARWLSIKITVTDTNVTVNRGVFVKSSVNIQFSQLLSISTSRNLLHILTGCEKCSFNTPSRSDKGLEIMLPTKEVKRLYNKIYGNLYLNPLRRQNTIKRFLMIPFVIFIAIASIVIWLILFMKLNQEALFVGMGLIFVDMCYGGFCYYDYKQGVLCFWDDIFAKGVDIVNTQNFYCKKSKVGIVKISQNPFDRRYGTCKMKLITRGECGKSIRVKYIMTKEVIRQISHQFKININV